MKLDLTPAAFRSLVEHLAACQHVGTMEGPTLDAHAREAAGHLARVARRKAPAKRLPGVSRKEKREAKRAAHREKTAQIWEAVMVRADGRCERCCAKADLVLDHMLGGGGQRRERQAVETTWALCLSCNWERTNLDPSADYWRSRMRSFLVAHGYPVPRELA